MVQLPPTQNGVLVATSRQAGPDGRAFTLEASADLPVPDLPDDVVHEKDLVEWMRKRGFRLTMVGGGSGRYETRRFYFRPRQAS